MSIADLFGFTPTEQRRARRADPITSKRAGVQARTFAGNHADRIHGALKFHGPKTAHELGLVIGLTVVQIDRRLPELKAQGRARVVLLDDGAVATRGNCRVWEAL